MRTSEYKKSHSYYAFVVKRLDGNIVEPSNIDQTCQQFIQVRKEN